MSSNTIAVDSTKPKDYLTILGSPTTSTRKSRAKNKLSRQNRKKARRS